MQYFLYHIPGKKIGVTCDLYNRVTKQQGYKDGEYEVLLSSPDIDFISDLERELQFVYGYPCDKDSYSEVILNKKKKKKKPMQLNVTEQTTTFPFPLNKLKGNLFDNLGLKFSTGYGDYVLTPQLAEWIIQNAKTSMFNPSRTYIYNKALHEHYNKPKMPQTNTGNIQSEINYFEAYRVRQSVFDKIRKWAEERGIYKNGDLKTQYVKLVEEGGELAKAILKNDKEEFIDAIGDMVVVLTNLAALEGLKIEDCIESAYNVIESRKGKMVNGTFVKETL